MPTIHLLIKGKVQGVFYRATAKQLASELGLTGWIKNTREGNVEATISGDEKHLKNFEKWCKQGPDKAVVEEVVVTQKEETAFNSFMIVR
ncbi:MAG: acylphosphatase [Ginsengibacter sp.]